jgi:DNA-binding HxlR family transcriptional regulator
LQVASYRTQTQCAIAEPKICAMPGTPAERRSPLDVALERVGDRWSFLVVEALLGGARRFNELQAQLPQIAPNILAQRLRRLEEQRVLRATPYSHRPPRVEYELTEDGVELAGVLRLLAGWGAGRGDTAELPRHAACGSALDVAWYCPTCSRAVEDDDASALRYL